MDIIFKLLLSYVILSYLFVGLHGLIEWYDVRKTDWVPADFKNNFLRTVAIIFAYSPITFVHDFRDMLEGNFRWTLSDQDKAMLVEIFIASSESTNQ